MRKLFLTIIISFITIATFAQTNSSIPKILKYVTMAPDGTVALTVFDNSNDESIKLEAANSFYKYQLLDSKTNEPIFSAKNNGKKCQIDKSKVIEGTYNIRLYTSNFVITSKIKVSASRRLAASLREDGVAMNE